MTAGSDNVFPKILTAVQSSDPAAPSDGSWKVYSKAGGVYARSSNSIVGPFAAASGAASLSYVQAFLGADVNMSSANTFYDGPTVTLSAGTWLINARLFLLDPTGGAGIMSIKLWDGTTVATNFQFSGPASASWMAPAGLSAVVVVASGTPTWKISAASQGTTNVIKAAGNTNISGNVASTISAVKIA